MPVNEQMPMNMMADMTKEEAEVWAWATWRNMREIARRALAGYEAADAKLRATAEWETRAAASQSAKDAYDALRCIENAIETGSVGSAVGVTQCIMDGPPQGSVPEINIDWFPIRRGSVSVKSSDEKG